MKLFSVFIVSVVIIAAGCADSNSRIAYPGPTPDSSALVFMPGIVSRTENDSLDFNSCFSPDGKAFYFSRSARGKYNIYVSYFKDNKWQQPILAPFTEEKYNEADPMFHPDGSLYFMSNRPKNATDTAPDFDIWVIKQNNKGEWSAPENVTAVNSDSTEYYVSFASNGNLYFASDRNGGAGLWDIYVSKPTNGKYSKPENLGTAIKSDSSEHDPCVSRDEQLLLFTSVGRKDGYGEGDIYFSQKDKDGNWSIAKNIGNYINTPSYEYCSYFSPDGKYYFFSSNFDIKWIDRNYLIKKINK